MIHSNDELGGGVIGWIKRQDSLVPFSGWKGLSFRRAPEKHNLNGIPSVLQNLMTSFSLICYYNCVVIINYYKVAKINLQVKSEVPQIYTVLHSKFEHELQCCVFRLVATPRVLVPSRDASC